MNAPQRPGSFRYAASLLHRRWFASSCAVLLAMLVLASVFADELASERPIICSIGGHVHVLSNVSDASALAGLTRAQFEKEHGPGDWAVWPLVACSAKEACDAPLLAPFAKAAHPLGTDGVGRDVLARLVFGTRSALLVAGIAVAAFVVLGTALGAMAGFFGGGIDFVVGRVIETLSAFPVPLLALVVQALAPHSGVWSLVAVIAALRWTEVARLVRAEVLSLSSLDYVSAARALGASPLRVLYRHVLPLTLSPIVVAAVLGLGQIVLLESALDFLRVGLPASIPTWGEMLSESRDHFTAWWLLLLPGSLVFASVTSTNAIGETLRDALDPRART